MATKVLGVRMSEELLERLTEEADRCEMKPSAWVLMVLELKLNGGSGDPADRDDNIQLAMQRGAPRSVDQIPVGPSKPVQVQVPLPSDERGEQIVGYAWDGSPVYQKDVWARSTQAKAKGKSK